MLNVNNLILDATKNQDKVKMSVFRALKAEILNYTTAKNAKEYNEIAEISIIKKMIKQREDAIEQYLSANRMELADNEAQEVEVLKTLLPPPVSRQDIINELGKYSLEKQYINGFNEIAIPKKEMGTVIKYLKEIFPTADGKDISNIVKNCTL